MLLTEAERVAEVMGGLATPARVLILARLLQSPATVGELTAELGLSQTAVSNHLRILRHLNLATGDRQRILHGVGPDDVNQVLVGQSRAALQDRRGWSAQLGKPAASRGSSVARFMRHRSSPSIFSRRCPTPLKAARRARSFARSIKRSFTS